MNVIVEGLRGSCDGKQSQTGGIECYYERFRDFIDKTALEENDGPAPECRSRIAPVANRIRRNSPNQNITNNAAAQRRRKCKHHKPQDVEVALYCGGCAFHGKYEGADQIDGQQ